PAQLFAAQRGAIAAGQRALGSVAKGRRQVGGPRTLCGRARRGVLLLLHGYCASWRAASTSLARGRRRSTGRLETAAALRPRMLRFACSDRKGMLVMALGGSKSQCGQSDANNNWVSARIVSKVASSSFRLLFSSG